MWTAADKVIVVKFLIIISISGYSLFLYGRHLFQYLYRHIILPLDEDNMTAKGTLEQKMHTKYIKKILRGH